LAFANEAKVLKRALDMIAEREGAGLKEELT